MGDKALIFDVSVRRLKQDGYTDSQISQVYTRIGKELYSAGFDERIQKSAYRTTNGDGINSLLRLLDRKDQYPLFCTYQERVHWMGCDEYSDITDAFKLKRAESLE